MWETIKNDPLLKTITIIILGVLGFGFAFNIMFGQNSVNTMDGGVMEGGGMSSGSYFLGDTLSYVLLIVYKLLLIALVIVLLMALLKFAGKYLLKGEKMIMENSNNDSILKTLGIAALAIVATLLLLTMFNGMTGNGYFYGMNSNDMSNMMNGNYNGYNMMNGSYNGYNMVDNGFTLGISGLLGLLLKVLLFISVTGFIVGLAMYIFRNFPKNNGQILEAFKPKSTTTTLCELCGTELKTEWKCCPNCGSEKKVRNQLKLKQLYQKK